VLPKELHIFLFYLIVRHRRSKPVTRHWSIPPFKSTVYDKSSHLFLTGWPGHDKKSAVASVLKIVLANDLRIPSQSRTLFLILAE
jgi:hypothetical protein